MVATTLIASCNALSRFPAAAPPPRPWHFRIKNGGKSWKKSRRQTVGGPGLPRSNDMSISDNVLQKTAKTARAGSHDRAISPADIAVGDRLRALDHESVERLKESISRIGLKTPISVRSSGHGWTLVSGRHRLEACIALGLDEIPVVAETGSELEARLWEIAENLHRAELTALERAEHISLWIGLRGERGEGRSHDQAGDKLGQVGAVSELDKAAQAVPPPAGGGRGREGGVRAAARELGVSQTDARRAVHRVDRIAPAVREALRDMPEIADNGVELDALAALPAEQQAAAVAAVKSSGAPNVRVAIATTAQPTLCAAANADRLLDAMLEQIRRLGKEDRQRLWDALADRWHEEIGRAFTCRLAQRPRPAADEIAEPLAASLPLIAEGDNKTDETRRREALSACATPSHPDARGGLVQPINGPFCERVYAIGSVEWAEQQRRGANGV
jgi:ParB family chromosome partitioning protein